MNNGTINTNAFGTERTRKWAQAIVNHPNVSPGYGMGASQKQDLRYQQRQFKSAVKRTAPPKDTFQPSQAGPKTGSLNAMRELAAKMGLSA